jgi:Zn-dependent peptidase ImmA (M78 family)
MYERVRQEIYDFFAIRGARIEINKNVNSLNFCCLKILYQPARGMTFIIGHFTDDVLEVLLIAHEFGHILHYENLSREKAWLPEIDTLAS